MTKGLLTMDYPVVDLTLPSKVYLLFEWTEEREAKSHLGVYSTMDKAQAASQLYWEHELKDRGAAPTEIGPVKWHSKRISTGEMFHHGYKTLAEGVENEDLLNSEENEATPYEIEEFDLDVADFSRYDFGGDYTKRPTYVENKVQV